MPRKINIELGDVYVDTISGMKGTVTGKSETLLGDTLVQLTSRASEAECNEHWFHARRLRRVAQAKK